MEIIAYDSISLAVDCQVNLETESGHLKFSKIGLPTPGLRIFPTASDYYIFIPISAPFFLFFASLRLCAFALKFWISIAKRLTPYNIKDIIMLEK